MFSWVCSVYSFWIYLIFAFLCLPCMSVSRSVHVQRAHGRRKEVPNANLCTRNIHRAHGTSKYYADTHTTHTRPVVYGHIVCDLDCRSRYWALDIIGPLVCALRTKSPNLITTSSGLVDFGSIFKVIESGHGPLTGVQLVLMTRTTSPNDPMQLPMIPETICCIRFNNASFEYCISLPPSNSMWNCFAHFFSSFFSSINR